MIADTDPFLSDVVSRWQLCRFCVHLHQLVGKLTCDAFPQGIPKRITSGMIIHKEPLPEQENGLIFHPC